MTQLDNSRAILTTLEEGGGQIATKRPVLVRGEKLDADSIVQTREGAVSAPAGDWVLQDPTGNRWPVSPEHLFTHYTRLDTDPNNPVSQWVAKPQTVRVLQLTSPIRVPVGRDGAVIQGYPNDWLVFYKSNSFGIVAADLFDILYELH
ncbi:MAG: hypothetical protein FJ184_09685 [Gammaproteobacteria bacterium]|nr:hypothetical protein [Gammaproteobacteria bacterium]